MLCRVSQHACWILDKAHIDGHKKGLDEGRRGFLLGLLRRRFVDIPLAIEERIMSATAEELGVWADRLFTAASLDEVFRTGNS